jgi:hypothetical protein
MTDVDRMTHPERRLRAELHRALVPPPTPVSLVTAVDALATEHLAGAARSRRSWKEAVGMGARGFRFAAGLVAVLVVAVAAVIALQGRGNGNVAATPVPTTPAMVGPALPSPAAVPTRLSSAGWIDPHTAIAFLRDRGAFRISADGGQTWSGDRSMPGHATDLGFGFTDATHGYSMWTEGAEGDAQAFVVDLTDDGGRSWRKVTAGALPASVGADVLGAVHFSDARHGVALGTLRASTTEGTGFGAPVRCMGWATDDGGRTWTDIAGAPCLWLPPTWPTSTLGYLVDGNRETWVTTDGGRTWGHGSLPDPGAGIETWTTSAVVTPAGGVRLIGGTLRMDGDPAPPLVVWQSDDGGITWREVSRNEDIRFTDLRSITAFDADHWLAAAADDSAPLGGTRFRETYDGGRTWADIGSVDIDPSGGVSWADRLHGALPGSRQIMAADGYSSEGYITTWLTNDGGRTWVEVPF